MSCDRAVSQENTALSQDIKSNLDTMLTQNPTREQLISSLSAVNTGIQQLQSNPLHMLVQGDALTNLQSMKASLEKQLAATTSNGSMTGKQQDDLFTQVKEVKQSQARADAQIVKRSDTIAEKVRAGAYDTGRKVDNSKTTVAGAVRTGAANTVSAIRSMPPPLVKVDVRVSATNVTKSITYQNRTGKSTGGYGGHAKGTGPLI
jgi:hypothetical protein